MFKIERKLMSNLSSVLITLLLLSVFLTIKPANVMTTGRGSDSTFIMLDLTSHDPIIIYQDTDFNETYGFPGNGSESNPYIIENYNISSNEVDGGYGSGGYGMDIRFTTKHFVIRNCYIEATHHAIYTLQIEVNTSRIENNICIGGRHSGIRCYSGVVEGNTIKDCSRGSGIYCYDGVVIGNSVENCSTGISCGNFVVAEGNTVSNCGIGITSSYYYRNSTIKQNEINNNFVGLFFDGNCNLTIVNNTLDGNLESLTSRWDYFGYKNFNISRNIFKNSKFGSSIQYDKFSVVENNMFIDDDLSIRYCANFTLKSNQFQNSNIRYRSCVNSSILGNLITNGGIEINEDSLEVYLTYSFGDNLANGKDISLFLNQSSILLDAEDYGQLILVNCTDSTIQNLEISNTLNCLYLKFCDNLIIQNNNFKDSFTGILSEGSDNLLVSSNILDNCVYGISFNFAFYSYTYCLYRNYKVNSLILTDNSFFKCGFKYYPFYYYYVGEYPDPDFQIVYEQNPITLENNLVNGKKLGYFANLNNLKIDREKYGQIFLVNCNDAIIRNQNLSYTTTGIVMFNCTWVTIEKCVCNFNKENGILLDFYSYNSTIQKNECNNNGKYGILLYDSGSALVKENQCNNNLNGIGVNGYYNRSGYNLITYNLVKENIDYGINIGLQVEVKFGSSNFNTMHHNTLIDNSGPLDPLFDPFSEGCQAYSQGSNNTWFDVKTKKGNFWSNWNGTGEYLIYGNDVFDPYPLSKPTWPLSSPELYALFSLVLVIPLGVLVYKLILGKRVL